MHVNRISRLFLVAALFVIPIGSASAAEPAPGPSAPPYEVIDVATSPTENERHPAAAYNPVENLWHTAYEVDGNVSTRTFSADGQTADAAEPVDPVGGVSDPLVAVNPGGDTFYPFFDLRFDLPPTGPGPNAPDHKGKRATKGDGSIKKKPKKTNLVEGFSLADSQYPIANGPGMQYVFAVFHEQMLLQPGSTANAPLMPQDRFHALYVEQMTENGTRRLYDQPMPGGFPMGSRIPLSDGTRDVERVQGVPLPTGGALAVWLEEGTIRAANVLTTTVANSAIYTDTVSSVSRTADVAAGEVKGIGLGIGPQGATIIYRTGTQPWDEFSAAEVNVEGTMLSYFNINPLTLERTSDPAPFHTENNPDDPAIACFGDGRCLAVWEQGSGGSGLWGTFFNNGMPGPTFLINNDEGILLDPDIAANSEDETFFALWSIGDWPGEDVKGAIIPTLWNFSGNVHLAPKPDTSWPITDVTLRLSGGPSPTGPWTILVTTKTDASGAFTLTTTTPYPYYRMVQPVPDGFVSSGSEAGPGGTTTSKIVIRFGNPGPGDYSGNRFWNAVKPTPEAYLPVIQRQAQ